MPINIDSALGNHAMALILRSQRAEILAANLAHADTPNYKARDIDFASLLTSRNTTPPVTLAATDARHLTSSGNSVDAGTLLYRIPQQAAIDGNTVDTQIEQAEFGRNALQYQASLTFLSSRIRGLLTAIRGE